MPEAARKLPDLPYEFCLELHWPKILALRAWPVLYAILWGFGEIPLAAFEALYPPDEARFQWERYRAYSQLNESPLH